MPKVSKFGKMAKAFGDSTKDKIIVVNFVQDPLGVLEETLTDPEFIGSCITTALECVPGVGPILASVFSLFWPADPKKAVTQEELDKKLEEFKTEMIGIMDSKIQESEVKTSVPILQDKINTLKHRLGEDGKANPTLKTYVRDVLELQRVQLKTIIHFCGSKGFRKDTIKIYQDTLFMYISVMNVLNTWWYQLEVDEYFISGKAGNKNGGEVKSLRERMHITVLKGITDIAAGARENKRDLLTPQLPDLEHAYIYRVDAAYFYPGQKQDYMEGRRNFPPSIEPVSGCYGLYPTPGTNLPVTTKGGKRKVQVRVLTATPLAKTTMQCHLPREPSQWEGQPKMNRTICDKFGVVVDSEYSTSGFAWSQLMYVDKFTLDFSGYSLMVGKNFKERVLFVEFIVHDKADKKPLTNIPPLPADNDEFEQPDWEPNLNMGYIGTF
ncbi:hypothetical protein DFA_10411 [Cavenderia fasciculata]|uniref:Pesticidal crystal protein N-terminal domain-containing protein n=1 Tax=Cavenderia fasciculata TaxID=261658 RepID=F4QA50_CACFS|nr:uncharacterized protein DFA_10411 [Cavenderia fasciculata]EGG15569.1 hypothetical protein DFA_10411 [Cavenderia fasciculata]|eukprot:XP_004354311.1 hypothetical protein DFA_10411 [Cavenderia fasciculata]